MIWINHDYRKHERAECQSAARDGPDRPSGRLDAAADHESAAFLVDPPLSFLGRARLLRQINDVPGQA
jgi:hypothetical protein